MLDSKKDFPIVTEEDLAGFTDGSIDDYEERFYTLNGEEIADVLTE